ncbi:2,5-diamino-6-(ribosylamino)-4(3H)-pyrimidinone 5'-phosphate reductase [Arthrobotrys conoides]|uniref:2,5-diamino-6-ribosylamino-4(3H)-pyrimidinone 5'-phosphate reductase n=1 Tax=Arthrobotrys conoides TaxID=74498 RepID=A0AAN8RI79_9PEZI
MSSIPSFPDDLAVQFEPYLPSANTNGFPSLTLTFATSLDSALSLGPGIQTQLSGSLTKAMTHHIRTFHSAILVGASTAISDDPGLNSRIQGAKHQPIPIVLDPNARWNITESSRVVQTAKERKGRAPFILVNSQNLDDGAVVERKKMLQNYGGGYIGINVDDSGRFKWETILSMLKQELGIESIMVEGGGNVINSLLEEEGNRRFVDNVIITIAPTWLGKGGVVVSPDRKPDPKGQYTQPRLKEVKWIPMEEDVVLCGKLNASSTLYNGP